MSARALQFSLCALTLILSACAPDYKGPIAEKPIPHQDDPNRIQTLLNVVLDQEAPETAVRQAFEFFDQNRDIILNRNWLTIVDFTVHSGVPRFYLIDLHTGLVEILVVAHGIGSDPDRTGLARTFSNDPNSLMTSLGFYLVNESYYGKWGLSARLDGLQDTNSNARERAVVLHGADYVDASLPVMGWTEGCLGVELKWIEFLVSKLRGRSLLYNYISGM